MTAQERMAEIYKNLYPTQKKGETPGGEDGR